MHIQRVFPARVFFHLPHGFKEQFVFNIADRAAYLDYHKVSRFISGYFAYVIFNDIRYVRDVLNCLSEVVALSLLFSYYVKYLPHGKVPA